ncbi:MAG: HD domain-containing protein [Flavobacterium sp.]|uniref:HD domain-containing protein n=1 Tax=Flavobacterium sp. TaxID=239 RepID=UPI0026068FEF|nr:HD domain-containing protein [Flavobacterium sp.]MDD5150006.1 HD domain-containing protein [Flavobacterium sp.]
MKNNNLAKALFIATNAHHNQYDCHGKPYILHAIEVMRILNTDNEDLNCIAVLHDVVEDTPVTLAELRQHGFPEIVIEAVDALTKRKESNETYDEYKQRVFNCYYAMRVKLADLTHNTDITRQKGIKEKDLQCILKYQIFYNEITIRLMDYEK